jgi:RimJ/RimL family protein N-acetyltransferase
MRYTELMESASEVTLAQQLIPDDMLDAANNDPFLLGFVPKENNNRLGIEVHGTLVGFMTPRENKGTWRTGAIYVLPEFRNKGIASKAIRQFHSDKGSSRALVEPHNHASRKAHENAGFKVVDRITADGEDFDVMEK